MTLTEKIKKTEELTKKQMQENKITDINGNTILNNIKVNKPQIMKERRKKISATYTLQRFKGTIETLTEAKMITHEELEQLKTIHIKMMERWISQEMGI